MKYKKVIFIFGIVFIGLFVFIIPIRADSKIDSEGAATVLSSAPDANFGNDVDLRVGGPASLLYITYIQFDIRNLQSDIQKVSVVLNIYNLSGGTMDLDFYIAADTWHESTITWNNRPSRIEYINTRNIAHAAEWTLELTGIDLTEYGNYITIELYSISTDIMYIRSDDTSSPPKLIIEYTGEFPVEVIIGIGIGAAIVVVGVLIYRSRKKKRKEIFLEERLKIEPEKEEKPITVSKIRENKLEKLQLYPIKEEAEMNYCPHCNSIIKPNWKVCARCGHRLVEEELVIEEPIEEQIVIEEPITEEALPKEELVIEEPIEEEIAIEEPITEEALPKEEIVIEEPIEEEIAIEEPITEEALTKEEIVIEEPIKEEVLQKEEVVMEEPIKEDIKMYTKESSLAINNMAKKKDNGEKQDYMNLDWLKHQYYVLGRRIQDIADDQKVSMIRIRKWLDKLDDLLIEEPIDIGYIPYCPNCGKHIKSHWKVCVYCGQRIREMETKKYEKPVSEPIKEEALAKEEIVMEEPIKEEVLPEEVIMEEKVISIQPFKGHKKGVASLVFSPNGEYIVSASKDKTIKIWDFSTGKLVRTLEGHEKDINSVALSFDGKYIVSGSNDNTVKIWNFSTGKLIQNLKGHTWYVSSVAVSPDGKYVISGSFDKNIMIWDLKTGDLLNTLKGHRKEVSSVAISPNGKYLISGSNDKTIIIWGFDSGEIIRRIDGHKKHITSIVVSSDGKYIISGSNDKSVKVWEITTGRYIRLLEGNTWWVLSVAVSPDSNYGISGSLDGKVKIWDLKTGEFVRTIEGHRREVNSITISPDCKYIVSGSDDKTIKIWNFT